MPLEPDLRSDRPNLTGEGVLHWDSMKDLRNGIVATVKKTDTNATQPPFDQESS